MIILHHQCLRRKPLPELLNTETVRLYRDVPETRATGRQSKKLTRGGGWRRDCQLSI